MQKINLSANKLKLIAIICMLIDHVGAVFIDPNSALYFFMRFIGRTTAPIMFYFLVEGYHKTKNIDKYTLRLFIFALISYLPFIYCFYSTLNAYTFHNFNVIYTLFLGLLVIRVYNEIESNLKWIIILFLTFLASFGDWTYLAIFYIFIFNRYYSNFKSQAISYLILTTLIVLPEIIYFFINSYDFVSFVYALINVGMYIPIILLSFYNGEKGKSSLLTKWGFYIFYPLHLTILALIQLI